MSKLTPETPSDDSLESYLSMNEAGLGVLVGEIDTLVNSVDGTCVHLDGNGNTTIERGDLTLEKVFYDPIQITPGMQAVMDREETLSGAVEVFNAAFRRAVRNTVGAARHNLALAHIMRESISRPNALAMIAKTQDERSRGESVSDVSECRSYTFRSAQRAHNSMRFLAEAVDFTEPLHTGNFNSARVRNIKIFEGGLRRLLSVTYIDNKPGMVDYSVNFEAAHPTIGEVSAALPKYFSVTQRLLRGLDFVNEKQARSIVDALVAKAKPETAAEHLPRLERVRDFLIQRALSALLERELRLDHDLSYPTADTINECGQLLQQSNNGSIL